MVDVSEFKAVMCSSKARRWHVVYTQVLFLALIPVSFCLITMAYQLVTCGGPCVHRKDHAEATIAWINWFVN